MALLVLLGVGFGYLFVVGIWIGELCGLVVLFGLCRVCMFSVFFGCLLGWVICWGFWCCFFGLFFGWWVGFLGL